MVLHRSANLLSMILSLEQHHAHNVIQNISARCTITVTTTCKTPRMNESSSTVQLCMNEHVSRTEAIYIVSTLTRFPAHNKSNSSMTELVKPNNQTYTLKRYLRRSLLNTFLPILVLAFYVFIVVHYFMRPSVNDVVPGYIINARIIFFTWIILSVFILEWAKSAIAGFEATALMKPVLAPSNAAQLLWHADRSCKFLAR